MKTEKWIVARLKRTEAEMERQVADGMERGWPIPFWDRNCVERHLLRKILGMKPKPYCAADIAAVL